MLAELSAHHSFTLRESSVGDPPPGCIQVRVEAIGICGSDMHYFTEGHIGDMPARYPMVLGHEPVGRVLKLGEGVSGWSVGDRAALEAPLYCYHCHYCMCGRHNLCENVRFMSSPEEPGFFRDRANLPAVNLLPLPANLTAAQGTLHEPLAIILHSFFFAKPKMGETAAVLGAGPIGLTTLAALKLAGVARVFVVEPLAHRRALALSLGADEVLDPAQGDVVQEIVRGTRNMGVDMAFDCVAKDDSINQSIRMARPAGRAIITGVPSEIKPAIEFHTLRKKEVEFHTVRRYNDTAPQALRLLSENVGRFAPMLTHERGLDQVQATFEMIEAYSDSVGKAVLLPR
jgi:L-iditol 2-dehydrogenase